MISIGLISGLVFFLGSYLQKMGIGQKTSLSIRAIHSLKLEIKKILNNPDDCHLSFAGPGERGFPITPVIFKKMDHDDPEEDIGIPVRLFHLSRNRSVLKFNTGSVYDGITINSIELFLPSHPGSHYLEKKRQQSDIGELHVEIKKSKNTNAKEDVTHKLVFPILLYMATNSSSETTLLGCSPVHHVDYEKLCRGSGKNYISTHDPKCILTP